MSEERDAKHDVPKGRPLMLKNAIKSAYYHWWLLPRRERIYSELSIGETFRRIYGRQEWGKTSERFHSGPGSRGGIREKYCEYVRGIIESQQIKSIVDLGCGDFGVGSQLVSLTNVEYVGVDVVPELIEHHRRAYGGPGIRFLCLDITKDKLPAGELYLIRQVLQHLSNEEIAQVLDNVGAMPRVIVSEDVPVHPIEFNRNKAHGPDTRAWWGSGVYVDKPPFSRKAVEIMELPINQDSILRIVTLETC